MLAWAVEHHVAVVPFGGGTSVTGGLVARREGYAGLVSLDLIRLDRLLEVDEVSMTARLQPGMRGPQAEAALAEHGLTLGHFPQSFELASIGGFAATRSSGQNSAGFGRFDQMVVGLRVATPDRRAAPRLLAGQRRRPRPAPAGARLGGDARGDHRGHRARAPRAAETALRRVALRVLRRRPGRDAHLAQHQLLPTIIRLSDETETALNLASHVRRRRRGRDRLPDGRGPRGRRAVGGRAPCPGGRGADRPRRRAAG